jgi:hypothetical protein
MRSRTTIGLAVAGVLAMSWSTQAQAQEPQLGELASVTTWQVEPAHLGTFLSVAAKVAQAAREAKLGEDYTWTMWQDAYTITIVGSFNRAELDDPQIWMKQFQGTPGEATLMEAFQEMEGMQIQRSINEIHQGRPDWTYEPEGMGEPQLAMVHVNEFWLKTGAEVEQKWNALIGDFMAFFKDVGYPYPIWGNMVRYGDQRVLFVTAYDDAGAYHGANSVEALAEKHMAGERWWGLIQRVGELTSRASDSHAQFLPEQSYMGAAYEGGSQ